MSEHEREVREALYVLLVPYRQGDGEIHDRTRINHQLGIHGVDFEELMAALRAQFGFDDSGLYRPDYVLAEESWNAADLLSLKRGIGEHLLPLYAGDLVRAVLYGSWPPPANERDDDENAVDTLDGDGEIDPDYGVRS